MFYNFMNYKRRYNKRGEMQYNEKKNTQIRNKKISMNLMTYSNNLNINVHPFKNNVNSFDVFNCSDVRDFFLFEVTFF